jgi:hypothetical protein
MSSKKFANIALLGFCFLLTAVSAFARESGGEGGEVGNGSGIAEQNISLAYVNLERYLALCLNQPSCQLSGEERNLLQKISRSMPLERRNPRQLQYGSDSSSRGSFWIDGQVRIAKTGDKVGSSLVFNRDLLYWRDPILGQQALSLPMAVAILVHELGHHHVDNRDPRAHSSLDLLGSKVQNALQENRLVINGYPYLPQLSASVINFPSSFEMAQLVVSDEITQKEISGLLLPKLSCDPSNPSAKVVGLSLWNLRWELHDQGNNPAWEIVGGAFAICSQGIVPLPARKFRIRVRVPIARPENSAPGPQSFHMVEKSISTRAEYCSPGDTSCQ